MKERASRIGRRPSPALKRAGAKRVETAKPTQHRHVAKPAKRASRDEAKGAKTKTRKIIVIRDLFSEVSAEAFSKWKGRSKQTPVDIARRGTALSREKMPAISKRHPVGTFVAFHLATGHYVTSGSQAELVAKFEAKFGDDWGWFERVQ
jgi:hypothetical protein